MRGSIWARVTCLLMFAADSVHAQTSQTGLFWQRSRLHSLAVLLTPTADTENKKLMHRFYAGTRRVCLLSLAVGHRRFRPHA